MHEDVLARLGWALAGGGLFQIYHLVAQAALRAGQHVEVLLSTEGQSRPTYVLYPQNRHPSVSVRTFVDLLARAAASLPGAS